MIEFHSYNSNTLADFKPVLAKSILPDWWKKTKIAEMTAGKTQQTIRACPAMDDWLKSGWIITANRDMHVINGDRIGDDGTNKVNTWDRLNGATHSQSHPKEQVREAFEYYGAGDGKAPVRDAFKFRNPWNIKTPPGYSCFYLDPFLFQNKYFACWQGIIDTDTFNVGLDNAQIIFYPKVDHSFIIKKGTPLCQIIPFKREEWHASYEIKSHEHWVESKGRGYKIDPHDPDTEKHLSMQEWGHREPFDGDQGIRDLGPYRNKKYWVPKAKLFNEDTPPPECPFHEGRESQPINKIEEPAEIQLELDLPK